MLKKLVAVSLLPLAVSAALSTASPASADEMSQAQKNKVCAAVVHQLLPGWPAEITNGMQCRINESQG